jgi:hypothetical protein
MDLQRVNFLDIELLSVVDFLDIDDILRLGVCSKSLFDNLNNQGLWCNIFRLRIAKIHFYVDTESSEDVLDAALHFSNVDNLISSFRAPSVKHLCIAFSKLSGPLLGYWVCPPNISRRGTYPIQRELCGRLYRVYSTMSNFFLVCLNSSCYVIGAPLMFLYNEASRSIELFSGDHGNPIPIDVDGHFQLRLYDGEDTSFYRLPPVCSSSSSFETELSHILGMHYAHYGPHGRELLWVSRHNNLLDSEGIYPLPSADLLDSTAVHIRGMKLVGDPNVPGWQLSFFADLTVPCRLEEMMEVANRPIYSTFGIIDLNARSRHVLHWFRGYGQINYVQGVWNPRWVGISFIVYRKGR